MQGNHPKGSVCNVSHILQRADNSVWTNTIDFKQRADYRARKVAAELGGDILYGKLQKLTELREREEKIQILSLNKCKHSLMTVSKKELLKFLKVAEENLFNSSCFFLMSFTIIY